MNLRKIPEELRNRLEPIVEPSKEKENKE